MSATEATAEAVRTEGTVAAGELAACANQPRSLFARLQLPVIVSPSFVRPAKVAVAAQAARVATAAEAGIPAAAARTFMTVGLALPAPEETAETAGEAETAGMAAFLRTFSFRVRPARLIWSRPRL
ncbi:hypothetical protein [Sinorhizobium meliloti]|uniref:hypothetical protein n=1 Tax=Rhizobium meliloti TaxID=382 RepID=UPI001360B688|nr:hypothetical protein [Sinorhizobium meliloti]